MNIKIYAVNADYRPGVSRNWYYVIANNKVEARRKFTEIISWLTMKQVVLVEDDKMTIDICGDCADKIYNLIQKRRRLRTWQNILIKEL